MASIEKRTTSRGNRWDVRYRGTDGRERSQTFTTRKAADRFATTVKANLLHGTWVDPAGGKVVLKSYADQWLDQRPKPLRPRTRETYEALLRIHILPTLGGLELAKLTPSVIRRWLTELSSRGTGANTAAKSYRLVHAILETAVADEVIARNPCVIKGAGVERSDERPVATVAEVNAAADAIADRYRCLVLLAGFVGLRQGELLGLENRHLNLLHGTLTVEQQQQELADGRITIGPPKSEAGKRMLQLPSFLIPELERHVARFSAPGPTGRVFAGEQGGPLRKLTLHRHWSRARAATDLGQKFRFHDLRHTANTLAASTGASTRELMHRMGHASSAAALRYQHATRDRDRALAVAVDEMVMRSVPAADGTQRPS